MNASPVRIIICSFSLPGPGNQGLVWKIEGSVVWVFWGNKSSANYFYTDLTVAGVVPPIAVGDIVERGRIHRTIFTKKML